MKPPRIGGFSVSTFPNPKVGGELDTSRCTVFKSKMVSLIQ